MQQKRVAALLMIFMLLVPAAACAQAMTADEAIKAACLAAGGEWLQEPHAVLVVSPYGTQSVVLRDAPSDSYNAVAMLMVGQELTVCAETEDFLFVLLDEETYGWLAADEVEMKK